MSEKSQKKRPAARAKFCVEDGCSALGVVKAHCRIHYLMRWKELKANSNVKAEKRLDDFVNRLAEKYPRDYLQRLKDGLEDDEKLTQVVSELETEPDKENTETEREFLENFERKVKIE